MAALETQELTKWFGPTLAVDRVNLAIGPGETFGLLGPNGAGKTSTLRMMCGLLTPSRGRVLVLGHDMQSQPREAKQRIGYLDEEAIVYPHLTGREFLHLAADLYGRPRGPERERRISGLFEGLGFADKADELIASYSHGTRQKVGLASVFVHDPEVMMLDEPTNGLDPRAARRVKDLLQELVSRGRTVVISTHILEIAQALCDRVAIMNRGTIAAIGTLEELRRGAGDGSGAASLEELFLQLTGGADDQALIEQLLGL